MTAFPAALPSSELVPPHISQNYQHLPYFFFYSMFIFSPNVNLHPLSSAPCIPSDVTTYVQCELSAGSVSWGSSDGADTYTAVATGLDGHTHACHTNTTSCSWDNLQCGEEYTVVVRANGDNCTSLPSNSSVIYMSMYDMLNKMSLTYLIKLLRTKESIDNSYSATFS